MNKKLLDFKYCVVIRTLGDGGTKYRALLDSIHNQSIKPLGVYIFIAEGYELPKERLGYEKFVITAKGMWHQRVYGMKYVSEKYPDAYQLVCDDDLQFEPDFVYKLYKNISKYNADVMVPHLKPETLPWYKNLVFEILGIRFLTNKNDYRIRICRTGGYAISSSKEDVMQTQSERFNIFIIKSQCIAGLNLEDEYWLETTYALPDDQIFFYKCFKQRLRIFSCLNPMYIHLDHGSSNPNRHMNLAYASGRNYLIFWYRFLFEPCKSLINKLYLFFCIIYRIAMSLLMNTIISIKKNNFKIIRYFIKGVIDGVKFIKSIEYKRLNKI